MLKRIVDKSNITSRKYFIEHCTVAGVNIAEESSMCSLRGVEHHRIIMQHDEHRQHQNNVYTNKSLYYSTVAHVKITQHSSIRSLRQVQHDRLILQHDAHRQHQNSVYPNKT